MRPPTRGGRRVAMILTATLAVSGVGASVGPTAFAADEPDPASVGSWSAPFEEGGSGTPRCELVSDPADAADSSPERLECKPAAVTSAMLPDGRVLYGNGIESEENAEEGAVASLAPESRGDRTRTLDLRAGFPTWDAPENETSDGDSPVIVAGRSSEDCLTEAPLGVVGAPGRGGDGLVGSVVSQTGVEMEPSCAPDDVQNNDGNIFCGDIAQMADGRQLLMGGTDWYNEPSLLEQAEGDPANVGVIELEGLRSARIFDYQGGDDGLGRWDATGAMKFGRWYPSALTLPDGSVAVVSGTTKLIKNTQGSQVRRTETYDPATSQWTERYTGLASEKTLPQNARVYLTPNGKLFYTGDGQMFGPAGQSVDEALFAEQGFFDFDNDEWSSAGITVPRSSPASVALPMKAPYDEMTILRAGGTLGPPPGSYLAVPTTDLTTVNKDGKVTNVAGPELNNARWFTQPTPLPTGEVLLTSGARNDEVVFPGAELPVKQPELYDPVANKFVALAAPERARTYHNNALLLPNGQVLVGGNSPISLGYGVQRDAIPGVTGNNDKDPSFELFSPPYLFRGDRPYIEDVQAAIAWNENFSLLTDDAQSIKKITLMRAPAPQHVMDNDTRTLELSFSQTGPRELAVQMPQDGVAAPPGMYYLFINRAVDGTDGKAFIPSVARIVQVGPDSDIKREALEPMGEDTVFKGNGATPTENNTVLTNPPNPLETPTTPGETDPMGVPEPAELAPLPEAPAGPEVPAPESAGAPEVPADPAGAGELPVGDAPPPATLPTLPIGSAGRRANRPNLR